MEQECTQSRLAQAMADAGMKQAELARRTGIDRGSISLYLSGRYRPKADKLLRLAEVLGVSPQWLSGGEETAPAETALPFPVITGVGEDGQLCAQAEVQPIPLSALGGERPEGFFVLRMQGLSMYPRLLEGDRLLVQRSATPQEGQILVLLHRGALSVRTLGRDGLLLPVNPEFPPRPLGPEDQLLGRVLLLLRQL